MPSTHAKQHAQLRRAKAAGLHIMVAPGADPELADFAAFGVFAAVDIRGDRSATGCMAVHEYVLARERYKQLQGDLELLLEMPPGMRRVRPFTQTELERQIERMRSDYKRRSEYGMTDEFGRLYGANAEYLVERMEKAYDVYHGFIKQQVREKGEDYISSHGFPMTREVWEEMCLICNPKVQRSKVHADAKATDMRSVEDAILEAKRKRELEELDKDLEQQVAEGEIREEEDGLSVKNAMQWLDENLDGMDRKVALSMVMRCQKSKWRTVSMGEEWWDSVGGGLPTEVRMAYEQTLADFIDETEPLSHAEMEAHAELDQREAEREEREEPETTEPEQPQGE